MKIAIMQPYFMPYIGYFQLINAVDKFVKAIHKHITPIHKKGINKVLILSISYCFFARKLERYIIRESFAKSDG